jgi:hypothetical protein
MTAAVMCMTPPTTGTLAVVTMGITVGLQGDHPPAHSRMQRLKSRPMLPMSARRPHDGGQP